MSATSLTVTATMDANLARIVGVPAAMLYNLLLWTSESEIVKEYDKDGWFYYTAKQFEAKTTFTSNVFTRATDVLVEAGLIEKKRAYKKGTSISVCHFRVLSTKWESQFTPKVNSGTHSKGESYIKEEKLREKDMVSPKDETCASPFDEKTKTVSIRPDAKDPIRAADRRAYAVANEVRKRTGLKGQADSAYKQGICRWLNAGYGSDDIIEANHMMENANDGFHETLTPLGRLSASCMDWYTEQKNKQSKTPKGVW